MGPIFIQRGGGGFTITRPHGAPLPSLGTLLVNLISKKYMGKRNIREYIMEMSHIASKLKALKLELSEDLLVHLVQISLPTQFGQFKVSYNFQKETWPLNELISHCVQEEERLKLDKTESAHIAFTSKYKGKGLKRKKDKEVAVTATQRKQKKKSNESEGNGCFFCGAGGKHLGQEAGFSSS
uniref:Retrovirus-related Pol polyprotein from transposon TNT 1-94 n=1 Tax=Cajanus cajan TaxID=3821 RepID=A0A151REB4_CAJCA|nr:hypothetical protein KK1_037675 [Cajanus cajan]